MNEVIQAASELQSVCQAEGWRFCFIGGLAQIRWGEPRETADADLALFTGFGGEQSFVRTLLRHFAARIADAESFALSRRVLLLRSGVGVGLDISLAALPYESLVIDRSTVFEYPGNVTLRICSAEDLIVLKAFAGRGQDWVDVERVIVRQAGTLDWNYIRQQLQPLTQLKDEPGILERLDLLRVQFDT